MQSEQNLTFSGGHVAKRLQYSNMQPVDSPAFKQEVTDFDAQRLPSSLTRYQNILEKIQLDHGLATYEDKLEERLKQLELDSDRNNNSTYLNQAYQQYLAKGESQRKLVNVDQEYHQYVKQKKLAKSPNLAVEDIISHPETLHFLETYFPNATDIAILHFVQKVAEVCHLDMGREDNLLYESLMKDCLTTSNAYLLSLNALEIATKDRGIYGLVEEVVKQVIVERQQRKQQGLNSQIVNELEAVTNMLDQRKLSIKREEARLQELEQEIQRQKNSMSDTILRQYDLQMKVFDDQMGAKVAALNKRYHVIEHTLKQKLKLIEQKGQLALRKNQSNSSDLEKLKSKIFSLEKQVQLYKGKNEDLERKSMTDKDQLKAALSKVDRLSARVAAQEKQIKEAKSGDEIPEVVVEAPSPVTQVQPATQPVKPKTMKPLNDEALKSSVAIVDGLVNAIQQFKRILGIHAKMTDSKLIGEMCYPYLSTILPPLIEITPTVLAKPHESCTTITSLLLNLTLFTYFHRRDKPMNTVVPLEELESARHRNKPAQYQVNEIMQQGQSRGFEVLMPQSKYLKSTLKGAKEVPRPSKGSYLQLTQSDEVQRNLVTVFRQYIQSSESSIKRQITNDLQKFEVSNSKVNPFVENRVLVSRCNVCFTTLMLAYETKDCVFAVKNVTYDLRNENDQLSRFLKQYITDMELIYVLLSRLQDDLKDLGLSIPAIELLLEMCAQGPHQEQLLIQLQPWWSLLVRMFGVHLRDNDFCEKLSIIIQRLLYHCHNALDLGSVDTSKFEVKLEDAEGLLQSNLRSIIDMIQ